ncbi:MAG: WD40 repeat domain-containing protein [Candidatus Brocadiia bacterium]
MRTPARALCTVAALCALVAAPAAQALAGGLVLEGHARPVTALGFAPDGSRIASGSEAGVLRVWDVASGRCLAALRAHRGPVQAVVVSPNGKAIASAGMDNAVKVWSAASFTCQRSFTPVARSKTAIEEMLESTDLKTKPGAYALAFSGTTRYLASGHGDFTSVVWDIKTGAFKRLGGDFKAQAAGKAPSRPVLSVAIASDARLAAAGDEQTSHTDVLGKTTTWATIYLWNPFTAQVAKTISADSSVLYLAFLPGDRQLVSAHANGQIAVWDATKGEPVKTLAHGEPLRDAVLAHNGQRLASTSSSSLRVWDLNTGAVKGFQGGLGADFAAVALSGDGARVAVGGGDAAIIVLEVGKLEDALVDAQGPAQPQPQPQPGQEPQPGGEQPAPDQQPKEKLWDE